MAFSLPALIADCLGIPEFAPRRIKQAVVIALTSMALLLPDTFAAGMRIYAERQAERLTSLVTNFLVPVDTSPVPVPAHERRQVTKSQPAGGKAHHRETVGRATGERTG